ncbi:MAG: XRE family transcriptional regulator [Phascolarctobacterium sp.]|nr:MAG: XRE family transcriptional regulator [Phascolarctobacterium sp.]
METITLKQARLLREKTQEELANLLGIHVQTYRKLEENPDEATVGQAKKLAAELGFSYDNIFFGKALY